MKREPTQEVLRKIYQADGLFKIGSMIYQPCYSQAQKTFYYIPIRRCSPRARGIEIITNQELGENNDK